jgi:hypothetical protein
LNRPSPTTLERKFAGAGKIFRETGEFFDGCRKFPSDSILQRSATNSTLRGGERDDQDDRGDFAIDGKVARAWRIGIRVKKSNLTNFAMVF